MVEILPSGNKIFSSEKTKERLILYSAGLSFGIVMIPINEFEPGTDEWNNKEIEIYLLIKKYS